MKRLVSLLLCLCLAISMVFVNPVIPVKAENTGFVTRSGKILMLNGSRFRVVGATSCYLMLDERPYMHYPSDDDIIRIYQQANALGINVIRTLGLITIGSTLGSYMSVQPYVGQWNETALRRMDKVIQLAGQYNIRLTLPLMDPYDYPLGGMKVYTDYWGLGDKYLFYTDSNCKASFKTYINMILNRTNYYTGVKYKDDPNIFCWQLGSEIWLDSISTLDAWMTEICNYIKGVDSNHLVMTGTANASFGLQTPCDIMCQHLYPNLAPPDRTTIAAMAGGSVELGHNGSKTASR